MQWHLDDYDYVVVNVSYPSLSYPIEELATLAVEQGLRDCKDEGASTISFVTHSLGGMLDYLELPSSHSFIRWSGEVLRQTAFFLQHGRFDRPGSNASEAFQHIP